MPTYSGAIEGEAYVSNTPFIVLGLGGPLLFKQFATLEEAKGHLATRQQINPHAGLATIWAHGQDGWTKLS